MSVTSFFGKGGFVPNKEYSLKVDDLIIDLRGKWLYQVGQVLNPFPLARAVARNGKKSVAISQQNSATGLYNTMVHPAINYALKGFIWYQGENNVSRAKEYDRLFPALIADWRSMWQLGDLPYIYAQLPNFMEVNDSPSESQWAELRESQRRALVVPTTGMAVTFDTGEWNELYPGSKKEIGEWMALWAEHLAYKDRIIAYLGLFINPPR